MVDVYFGDDFGQKIDLTVRIREILRNYPEGTSIFKEMVQNADDAGATEVNLCLDYRQHAATKLAYEKLGAFQGPSLLVHNNATFTDADFQSIQRIGDSLKKDNSKGWKTGRFGVGFNSVYHVTDLPAFVSGSQLAFHLPNVNPSNPGKLIDFIAHPGLVTNFPDQVLPFRCFGCDFAEPFTGTLFRLALRTEEQAQRSKLSHRAQTPAHLAEMLQEFAASLPTVLLFLRNVCKISIWEWRVDEDAPTILEEALITSMTSEIVAKRSLQHTSLASSSQSTPKFSTNGTLYDYPLTIVARDCITTLSKEYEYLIMNQLGGGDCSKIACDPANVDQRLVPWGGVAVSTTADSTICAASGLAFCFLPLPAHTYLPVHVNGYFELSSNRRDIWFGEGLSGEGLLRAQWNIALLRDVIAPCYARAILHLANNQAMAPDQHVQLLPQALPPAPWDSLTYAFFSLIRTKPCLYTEARGGQWVSPAESMVVRSSYSNSKQLEQLLVDDGFPVVRNLAEDLERVLVKTATIPSYVEPQAVREEYKTKQSVHAGNRKAIECLLNFMLSDLKPDTLSVLIGVNFLPVADGTLRTFESRPQFDPSDLDYLRSMGFSRQQAVHALAVVGDNDVETALNWLLQNPNPSIACGEGVHAVYLIPSREELAILDKARGHLIDIEAVSSSGLKLLSSDIAGKLLNVHKLDYLGFEDMLAVVLPAEWFGKQAVPWTGSSDGYTPNDEWFRQLWQYIGKSDHLAAFQEKWPIVPTSSDVVAQLSLSAGVLSAELLPDGCLRCLQKLRVRLLLPNLFASFRPNPDVWQYIHQPTAVGVLSCIDVIIGMAEPTRVEELFEHADRVDREHLLSFLSSAVIEDADSNLKRLCCNLPIFPGFQAIDHAEKHDIRWVSDEDDCSTLDSGFLPTLVSVAQIKARYHEALLCVGVALKFLDDNFIWVKEGDALLVNFLSHLGVRRVSKVEFFAKYLIPRFNRIAPNARVKFVYELLTELTALLAHDSDGTLLNIIETSAMFPTMTGELKSIEDLYDPEIDEFVEIMDESFFPALELQDPQPLSVLRSIGLQRALSRRSILSLAVSIEDEQKKIATAIHDVEQKVELDGMCEKLRARSVSFFQYVDSHMSQLVTMTPLQRQAPTTRMKSKKSKGIRLLRNFLSDDRSSVFDTLYNDHVPTAKALEKQAMEKAEIEAFKSKLAAIGWVPVCEDKPHPVAPWYQEGERIIVASPQQSRPSKYLWLCSSQFHIIKCSVHSEILRSVLGWEKHLPIDTIAVQLKEIARMFDTQGPQSDSDRNRNAGSHGDTHMVWSAVYNIYQLLSRFFENEQGEHRRHVLQILSGNGKYVWVGDRFVSASHVATVAVVNAEPYLYTIPNELLHFRPLLRALGVRERFALADYVHVLGVMRKEGMTGDNGNSALPLSRDQLAMVIGLIQLISDTLQHASDYELYAPDRNGALEFAAHLTYDDAPWLDKRDYETSLGSARFIHPKISNEVAAKIGCCSLRSQLLSESSHEAMSLGGESNVEAFGQTEALTKRIAHILEQYPDGPNILSELIQNADDAGATRVCVLYNSCSYGTSSLLSPAMDKWQGPSLFCYNDAEFSDADFVNLARIGQASKLQRAATTGRFGLGFNSVYHFTDLPSIVSAKSIVMFDPHATHLPGISAANPGIKIRFANASIVKQFPDQFAPFKGVFGCDLEHHYKGTLFRFPLRTSALAECSEIKRRGYSHNEIVDLFQNFSGTIIDSMLFLRNVCKVEVYLQTNIDHPPMLLYGAEVPEGDRGESWRKIDRFMWNDEMPANTRNATELSAKSEFYARLRSTPAEELPSVTQVLHIRRRQQKELANTFCKFESMSDFAVASTLEADEEYSMDETVETYLVCNQIGGGKAREMACAAENELLKLIPWVGIAGRIDGVAMDGRAFCFLPLPVRVGLPVHINGYFELSSNRRDIWIGDDMSGDGKLRSEWNTNLLVDAVAPAYLTFLLEAKAMCEEKSAQYFSYFPTKLAASPWGSITLELFRIMKTRPMFFTSTAQVMSNPSLELPRQAVAPSSCVLVDDSLSDWKILEMALGTASLATVHVPVALRSLFIELDVVYGAMTPGFYRQLTRQGNFLPLLAHDTLKRVVHFCLSDCQGSSVITATALDQVPLLPLKNGTFGRLCFHDTSHDSDQQSQKQQQLIYFCGSAIEEELVADFPHRVVRSEFKELFDQLPFVYDNSNLNVMDIEAILDSFLPPVLGRCWSKTESDVFTLHLTGQALKAKEDWIRLLWKYVEAQLQTIEQLPQTFLKWPLIPILCADQTQWVSLSANVSLVLPYAEGPVLSSHGLHELQQTLTKVGIYVLDVTYLTGKMSAQWLLAHKYAHKLTSNGLLASLSRYQFRHNRQSFDDMFATTTSADRQVLCDFFSQNTYDTVSEEYQPILFELAIFSVYGKPVSNLSRVEPEPNVQFVSLRRGGFLPDTNAGPRVLNDSFFRAEKEATRRFLRDCGIEELTYTRILLEHIFPQLAVLERHNEALVDSVIIQALETLPLHQRNDARFRTVVATHAIIPSRKRVFRAVNQLHDPSVSELSELVGENSLPAAAFSTPPIVAILRSLGLRTGLSCHAVLESARSIEAMYREDGNDSSERACLKAHSLLAIVNNHFDSMMSESDSSDWAVDQEGTSEQRAIHDIVTVLKQVQWLPVRIEAPDPAMPWKSSIGSSGQRSLLSSASSIRPLKDAWFCSSSMNILDGELTSKTLVAAFGWNDQVAPFVIADQLEAIGSLWEEHCHKQDTGALPSTSTSRNWRFPLSEVHLMYQELETFRLADMEGWATSPLYRKLKNALWIWTGKDFAYPCQIAMTADASLEPLLHSCPSEHIIPRSLLASFGIADAFTTVDYLEAIMRLPRSAVLNEKQVAACVRIYDILANDTVSLEAALASFGSQEMVLMDQTNQLIAATELTFDDMEWNESREVRRGALFVSKQVPKTVALLLGAASLHSELARTSVPSRRVVCPSVDALQRILPPQSEWRHALLWETILAADRLQGTQVDFYLDSRHHSSQRVIEPSLQSLQDEALCIHIHGKVLSENDINKLFHGESSPRAGLLCGFMVSDCMQLLSGEGFYILDPTGCYLSSSAGAATKSISPSDRMASIGRRYEVLSQDFVRYPDQLLPFTTLPSCPSNVSRGTQSTLIRFPLRKTASALSSYVLESRNSDKVIRFIKSQLHQTLIFTESVSHLSLWSVGKESEFASHCHGEVSLEAPERTLGKRKMTRENHDWKKKFSLQTFFKSAVIPENQMEFVINLEVENQQHRDTWLFADNNGWGRSRDLACTAVHEMLHSVPYVSVASHILHDGNAAPRLRGYVYTIINTGQQVGLPVHVNGCFKKTLKDKFLALTMPSNQGHQDRTDGASGSEQQIAAGWNRILMEDGASDAYVKLLMVAKRHFGKKSPKALYKIWPTLQKQKSDAKLGTLIQKQTYHAIGTRELFYCTDGQFRSLSGGYQLDLRGMNIQVASFAQLHFPAFDVPTSILQDCSRLLPSRVYAVTPQVMRRFLKSLNSSEIHVEVCLSLLEYCLSDLPFPLPSETDLIWTEFHGLSLLPLEDGSIGTLRVNQRRTSYVLATYNQIELLRPLGHLFVSLATSQRLRHFFSETRFTTVFGLTSFSIKILADHIEQVLPPSWKNKSSVQWDPNASLAIDQLWLYRFWQVVQYERRSLGYFANWPLIPVKNSRLISCSKMDMAVCVWDNSADTDLSTAVVDAYQASALQQENKMAHLEAEYQRFMELSHVKFQTDDQLAEETSSNGQESADEGQMSILSDESSSSEASQRVLEVEMEDIPALPSQTQESPSSTLLENEDAEEEVSFALDSTFVLQEDTRNEDAVNVDDVESADIREGLAGFVYPVDDESREFCSRETLHSALLDLNLTMLELAYFKGQERDIVPSSADVSLVVLDGIFASMWETLHWEALGVARAMLLAEFFSHNGNAYGGYNRVQLDKLKQLPIFVNVRDVPCAISGGLDFFLIPPDLDMAEIPLPPDAQQCFLKSNPRLNAFYQELGVEEMSDSKLLIYVLPLYNDLLQSQRDQILHMILQKWQTLRGNSELVALLRTSALFHDGNSQDAKCRPANAFCDPRNSVLATIYDDARERFPAPCYRTPEWLDLMSEIGLQTEVTIDIFVECAQRIDGLCAAKQALSAKDECLTTTLHQYFVQNFDKFDRSQSFFERITPLAFVPAVVYETCRSVETTQEANNARFASRSVVRKYSECATLDDQALVYSTMPIMASVALPSRVLYSRLGIQSPPPQDQVVAHLLSITNPTRTLSSRSLDWQFFLPMTEVFQAIFKFLQDKWEDLGASTQQRLINAAIIPVSSTLVKGSRLFFHLGENLAPLMFEVPRVFGAYDALFRRMGSKESPEVGDYIRLLRDLNDECGGHPLNLNELIAASRSIDLLVAAMTESNYRLSFKEKKSIFLPSGRAIMQSMLVMAYNDSAALCSSIDLTELHVVHPRVSTRCCKMLGVPGITSIVTEELRDGEPLTEILISDDVAHFTSMLASQTFADGLRRIITSQQQKSSVYDAFGFIPDFEDLNERIVSLATYEVKCVAQLQSCFIAKLDCPARSLDVTKTTRHGSLSFLDETGRRIYLAKRTFEERSKTGMRMSQLVAKCINQLLGGVLQDCSVLESILTCDEVEIPAVLQQLDVYEDPVLIVEKLRGVLGQPLCETDCANVELAPLRSCLPGELVAVEDESGTLCYGKILQEAPSDVTGVSQYEVKVDSSSTRWMLATQLYFFRSARIGTNSHHNTTTSGPSQRQVLDIAASYTNAGVLPTAVVPIDPETQDSETASRVKAPASMVSSANVLSAVNDLLSRLNVTLDMSVEDLMAENMRLQRRLEVAEASRHAAAAQIDTAMREKKEVQDSLVCAVCLENQVNRVLIPCGHIYCASCVEQLPRPSCPICRDNIASSSVFHVPS